LERFFEPALGATGTVTAGIAPDNAYGLVVETIRSARESIEVEAYTLEHYGLVMELVERTRHGVRVTVLLEGTPVGGIEDQGLWACQQLYETGRATCAFMVNAPELDVHDRYTYLHAKFIIVDRERLLVGSQNLNHGSLPDDDKGNGTGGSRGVVLVTDSPEMVARAVEIFEADYDPDNHADVTVWDPENAFGYRPPPPGFVPDRGTDWMTYTVRFPETVVAPGTWFELVTAPESTLRTSDALLGLIARAGAGDGIYVEQLYETQSWGGPSGVSNPRLQAYVDAARRGARVRILLNGGMFDIEYISLTENVETVDAINAIAEREGLDMKAYLGDPTQYGIHNKMVLVDLGAEGRYAHVGSINGSETASKVNREMALQVRSSALFDYLHAMFEYDWAHRRP
jgi:phosphatidylserine/phosphatidylglycerophosphate/cardiolipin synthase-like enzyme